MTAIAMKRAEIGKDEVEQLSDEINSLLLAERALKAICERGDTEAFDRLLSCTVRLFTSAKICMQTGVRFETAPPPASVEIQ